MEFIPFNQLKPSMIEVCINLSHPVSLNPFFYTIPIQKLLPNTYIKGKRNEYISKFQGSVTAVKFMRIFKGYPSTSGCFKNAITMTMSTGEKNICIKFSKDTIHITGLKTYESLYQIVYYCFNYLRISLEIIDYCNKHKNEIFGILDMMMNNTTSTIINDEHIEMDKIPTTVIDTVYTVIYVATIKSECNSDLCSIYLDVCNWLTNTPHLCDKDIYVKSINKVLVNYNYHIGFPILKPKVEEYLDGVDDFECICELERYFITIHLPYEIVDTNLKRKSKRHTFMLYNTGSVTQSGPYEEIMKTAYETFMINILSIRQYIESKIPQKNNKKKKIPR